MLKIENSARTSATRAAKRKSDRSIARAKKSNFSEVIGRRRRELNLTQDAVATRIKTSTPYVGHLESSRRHPSDKIVTRLAEVLGLDSRKLFFLANPETEALISVQPERAEGSVSAWDQFRKNEQLQRIHNVSNGELELLSQVTLLGEIHSPRDLIYVLNAVRHALGR